MTEGDIVLLNKLLKQKAKLYKEYNKYVINSVLTNLLIKLVEEKYVFSRENFDNFIGQACAYTSRNKNTFIGSSNGECIRISKYMLTTFIVNEEQFEQI